MSKQFKQFAAYLFDKAEGHRSNKRSDPGGLTINGFSADRRRELGLTPTMPRSVYMAALKEHYWDVHAKSGAHPVVIWTLIDAGFNHGERRGIKMMQRGLGIRADGVIGPITASAMRSPEIRVYLDQYAHRRREFYARLTAKRRLQLVTSMPPSTGSFDQELWDEYTQTEWGWQRRLDRLLAAMWDYGLLKRAPTKTEANTAVVIAAGTTVAATVAVEAITPGIGSVLLESATQAASSVNPVLGLVLPTAAAWLTKRWAKFRGR